MFEQINYFGIVDMNFRIADKNSDTPDGLCAPVALLEIGRGKGCL